MKATKKMIAAVTTGVIADVNKENFNEYVNAVFTAASSIRDNIQVLTVFAVKHAQEHDNSFNLLQYLLGIATSKYGNGVRTATLQAYIERVVGGALWMTVKGENVFKKASKKTKVKYDIAYLESVTWYEHDNDGKAVPKMDFMQMLEQAMVRWDKAHEKADNGEAELVNADANDQLASEFAAWLESKKAAQPSAVAH